MKVTAKGQVTIPQEIREYFDIKPNTEVDFVLQDKNVSLVAKGGAGKHSKFSKVFGILSKKWTADGIMKLTRE